MNINEPNDFLNISLNSFLYQASEKLINRDITSKLEEINKFYRLPEEMRERLVRKNLVELLRYCEKNVPYYTDLFQEKKISLSRIEKNFDYFQDIPTLSKNDIFRNYEKLISNKYRQKRLIERRTNGSTGKSLPVLYSKSDLDWSAAANLYSYHFSGRRITDRECHIEMCNKEDQLLKDKCILALKNKALNRDLIQISNLNDSTLLRVVNLLKSRNYKIIQTYPSTMFAIANFIRRNSIYEIPKVANFVSTGEAISKVQRKVIESIFKCQVLNRYGLAEFGVVAHTSVDSFFNLMTHGLYPEYIGVDSTNSSQLILTGLKRRAMPLIRYETGDLCELSDDGELKNIFGRTHDLVWVKEDVLPTYYFQDFFLQDENILDFSILIDRNKELREIELFSYSTLENKKNMEQKLLKKFENVKVKFINEQKVKSAKCNYKKRYVRIYNGE